MIIESASINFHSRHYSHSESRESESIQIRLTKPQASVTRAITPIHDEPSDVETGESHTDSLKALIVKKLFKETTGRDAELFLFKLKQTQDYAIETSNATPQSRDDGLGLLYQHTTSYRESEQSEFAAEGTITTNDGRTLSFASKLQMSREYYRENQFTVRVGNAIKIDPLVINFGDHAAELSDKRIAFDLDADGKDEHIATLNADSGMLALDKNADGIINDGSELFGPTRGDGFDELTQYNSDHNQFIDEADPIYRQLKILQLLDDGTQQLLKLSDKKIGAIYLGHSDTPFQIKTDDNRSLGEIAASGIYLSEQGEVGTVQQINFTA